MNLKLIIFDMDGVILDSERVANLAWNLCGGSFPDLFLSCGKSGSRRKNGRDCKLCESAVFHLYSL